MKQLYCLLLVIIFLYFVYGNKLVEANDHEYDTSQDSNVLYNKQGSESGFFDAIGLGPIAGTLLPDEYKNIGSNVGGIDCKKAGDDCSVGISAHMARHSAQGGSHDWHYGNKDPPNDSKKKKCMNCMKCKDNYAFTDEFYSHMCDTLAGCMVDPSTYTDDSLPYVYAYEKTDFANECKQENLKNPLQGTTCTALHDNPALKTLMLLKKADTISCTAEIATLDSPIGSVISIF